MLRDVHKYIYCNVFVWLQTRFGLVIDFINNPQVVTSINSYTVTYLHSLRSLNTNLLSVYLH
jgi:hypothetical protein